MRRSLTIDEIPAGSNIDTVETFDVFNCDNCGTDIARNKLSHVQGTVIFSNGTSWPLNADLCTPCQEVVKNLVPKAFRNGPPA